MNGILIGMEIRNLMNSAASVLQVERVKQRDTKCDLLDGQVVQHNLAQVKYSNLKHL